MASANWAESVPPIARRMYMPSEDYLCLVIWNLDNKKGITLKSTRPYIVFGQCLRKFIGKAATPQETREGFNCLFNVGVTVHGNFMFYLSFEDETIPYDDMHEVLPFIVMGDEEYRTNDPIQDNLAIARLLDLNTEQFPARLVRKVPDKIDPNWEPPVAPSGAPDLF